MARVLHAALALQSALVMTSIVKPKDGLIAICAVEMRAALVKGVKAVLVACVVVLHCMVRV